jgi:two-component system CheB/CheR fusion protein
MNVDDASAGCSPDDAAAPPSVGGAHNEFSVVGIGASAGGLDALKQLLAALSDHTGMAFVIVQHLDPNYQSHLAELLGRATRMPVLEAVHGAPVQPDHLYVIPPNANVALGQGQLIVTPRSDAPGPHLPVDHLFRSLAAEKSERAIGIVLSGTGSDGTLGLCEIKAIGGITFAQDEKTATHTGMPHSAIESGCVDFILAPADMAARLAEIAGHPYLASTNVLDGTAEADKYYKSIISVIQNATGVDFSQYRDTTIRRRIVRRMALHARHTLKDYAEMLRAEPEEIEALYRDLLINVTSFFRDPELFETLKRVVFPEIIKTKTTTTPIRIWVPGCSTGQEPYSLAMALLEFIDDKPLRPPIQIFATDLSDHATLEKARGGLYPESIESEVSPERLRRFFVKEDHRYRIDKSIREMCVFARQNILADPPFSHVDLVSCRNVLIYMSSALQQRVIPTFHFALSPAGYLALGTAETVGGFGDLFELVDRAHKIYVKKAAVMRPAFSFSLDDFKRSLIFPGRHPVPNPAAMDFQREADRLALGQYAPPSVLVNDNFDIIQFRGQTSNFLAPPLGEPTSNILKMAREGLFLELRSALSEAKSTNKIVRREGLQVYGDVGFREIALRVLPVLSPQGSESCFLVVFEESDESRQGAERVSASGLLSSLWKGMRAAPGGLARPGERAQSESAATSNQSPRQGAEQLRHELAATKEYLQSLVEQQDASNEELRSANEEILSSNEELQSTNEELETAKEELQSVNEELTTVNEQLQKQNADLNGINNDLTNIFASTSIAIVMVGNDLRIRRITPPAQATLKLLPTDVGRSIGDLKLNINVPDIESLLLHSIEKMQQHRVECQGRDGHWYSLRIHPYVTADRRIDGGVLVLVDIDELKRSEARVRESAEFAEAIVQSARVPLIVLDEDLRVQTINAACSERSGNVLSEVKARTFAEVWPDLWNNPSLQESLAAIVAEKRPFENLETADIGQTVLVSGRSVERPERPPLILMSLVDITARKEAEEKLREANRRKDEFLAMLAHELRNPLAAVKSAVEIMRLAGDDWQQTVELREILGRQVDQMVRLVGDLLDISRIAEGKVEIRKEPVWLADLVAAATDTVRSQMQNSQHQLTVKLPDDPVRLFVDRNRFVQVLSNLLGNAAKFTDPGGKISLTAERMTHASQGDEQISIRVRDSGQGIPAELLPRIFDLFAQGDCTLDRNRGGLGVGLTLVKSLIELQGGTVEAHSAGRGAGSEFVVRMPINVDGIQEQPATVPTATQGDQARKVVIVDDNRDAAESLTRLLRMMGHEVHAAFDGHQALGLIEKLKPDIALIDIGLPGMNGYEVAGKIREQVEFDQVRLVAYSGYAQDEDRRRSREAGFDDHFAKPLDAAALNALIMTTKS